MISFPVFAGRCYLAGLALGFSACFLKCALLLFPLVARFGRDWCHGLLFGLGFGAGKMTSYALLGGVAVFSGALFPGRLVNPLAAQLAAAGLVVLGSWFFWREGGCPAGLNPARWPAFLLGLVYACLPCPPLAGFLLHLAWQDLAVWQGMASGAAFGLGTMTGPLLFLCGLFPLAGARIARSRPAAKLLRVAGAAVFFWWAARLVY